MLEGYAPELNMPAAIYIDTHGGTGIAGSDDHAGIDIGRTFTTTPQAQTPVIGFIGFSSADDWSHFANAFSNGLAQSGYIEGRNVAVQYRWAEYQTDRLPALLADSLAQKVAVLVPSAGIASALAAKAATSSTPIVFIVGGDPV